MQNFVFPWKNFETVFLRELYFNITYQSTWSFHFCLNPVLGNFRIKEAERYGGNTPESQSPTVSRKGASTSNLIDQDQDSDKKDSQVTFGLFLKKNLFVLFVIPKPIKFEAIFK